MDQLLFVRTMKARRLLGITIASQNQVWRSPIGFVGTYRHVIGVKIKEEFAQDATLLAIAEELFSLQSASRLLTGQFFYASMNHSGAMSLELFYNDQFTGEEFKREIHPKFLALMQRFTEWMLTPVVQTSGGPEENPCATDVHA